MSYPHTKKYHWHWNSKMFLYGIFRLFFDNWDSWLHILIGKIAEKVERWEENIYRHHLGQSSHLGQVAQDVVWLSFDYHQRWPLWPTCSSLQLKIIFSPHRFDWICCIFIVSCVFFLSSLRRVWLNLSYSPVKVPLVWGRLDQDKSLKMCLTSAE